MKSKDPRFYMPPEHDPKPSVGIGENGYFYDPVSGLFRQGMSRRGFLTGLAVGGVSVFTAAGCSNTVSVLRPEAASLPPAADAEPPHKMSRPAPMPEPQHVARTAPKPQPMQHAMPAAKPVVARQVQQPMPAPQPMAKPAPAMAAEEPHSPWVREPRKTPAPHKGPDFNFAVLADAHINGPRNPLMKFRLETAIRQINELDPLPDFVMYCGDLIQNGNKEEFDYFDAIMAELKPKVYYVPGEHDYFLDLGEEFFRRYGPSPFSFDHKGTHVIGLNGVVTRDFWTSRNMTPQQRMKVGGTLTAVDVQGPFMLGREQLDWLERDLSKIANKDTPILLFTHIPLYHYYLPWNMWTEDAPDAHALLKPFHNVQVFHGHVHNLVENRIGHIDFTGILSTSWPHPYPYTYHTLGLTGQMPRSNPALPLDGLGWHNVHVQKGAVTHDDILWTLKT